MSIDTRNKRGSAIGFLLVSRLIAPNPDGSLAAVADRQQVNFLYSGIDAGAGPPPPPPSTYPRTNNRILATHRFRRHL